MQYYLLRIEMSVGSDGPTRRSPNWSDAVEALTRHLRQSGVYIVQTKTTTVGPSNALLPTEEPILTDDGAPVPSFFSEPGAHL